MNADLLILNAHQLLTCASPAGPKRGHDLADPGLVENGAIAVLEGQIVAAGTTPEVLKQVDDPEAAIIVDAADRVVLPGFVDPHTHLLWAGDRAGEFEMRIAGASYMEIMDAGGGIMNTVRATRAATIDQLIEETLPRLDSMIMHGTTTAEVKTGYGLDTETEIKMLDAIRLLDEQHPLDLIPTFLGAHAVPPDYADTPDRFVDLLVEEMLPAVAELRYRVETPDGGYYVRAADFCDVFCEVGAFDVAQSRRILETARDLGLGLKIHADEFEPLGGSTLAVELGAISADHLVCTTDEQLRVLATSDTVAVSLPGTPFGLGHDRYTRARTLIDQGAALALATDLNPGTCWGESMQFIISLACRSMQLTPAEAICATTINGAHALGLGDYLGSLEVGKQADILVLDIPDFRHLGYRFGTNLVETVIKRGAVI
ncbi:MAG: imidazolonepropionase [Chloroflexota bacterium]|nr:imidazolonepropionase [Chloroflexota bacterium]